MTGARKTPRTERRAVSDWRVAQRTVIDFDKGRVYTVEPPSEPQRVAEPTASRPRERRDAARRKESRAGPEDDSEPHQVDPQSPLAEACREAGITLEQATRFLDHQTPFIEEWAEQRYGTEVVKEGEERASLRIRTPDLTKARPPRFIWDRRLLAGYLNLLLGEEGVGKGVLLAWIVARLTTGELPGDFEGRPVGVAIMSDEDSFDDVWGPRLHAAGADIELVRQIDRPDGGFVHIAEDRAKLKRAAREHGLEVFIFDQLLDHLGVDVDAFNQKKVRDSLQPLRALARELDVAAIGALHPNKRAGSFRQLVFGSGFNQVSRSSLWVAKDADDPDLRVLVRGKGNLSAPPPSLTFRIDERRLKLNKQDWGVPYATSFLEVTTSVEDLLEGFSESRQAEHSKIKDTKDALARLLPRDGKWHPASELIAEIGVDRKTAQRARDALGIEHRKTETFPARTEWRWPDTAGQRVGSVQSVPSVHSGSTWGDRTTDRADSPDRPNERSSSVRAGRDTPKQRRKGKRS